MGLTYFGRRYPNFDIIDDVIRDTYTAGLDLSMNYDIKYGYDVKRRKPANLLLTLAHNFCLRKPQESKVPICIY